MTRSSLRSVGVGLLVAIAYVAAVQLSNEFASLYTGYAPFWPAAGLASGSLAVLGLRFAPAIALGSLVGAAFGGLPVAASLWFAAVDAAEACLVAQLIRRWPVQFTLARLRDVSRLALAGLAGGGFSAFLNAPVLHAIGRLDGALLPIVTGWTIGNGIGHLVAGGALLVWGGGHAPPWRRHPIERAVVAAAAAAVSTWVFLSRGPFEAPRVYLVLALVTWTAARLGQRAVAAALLGLSALAAWAVVPGTGPFDASSGRALQLFLGVCALSGFGIAAVAAEREEAAQLRELDARYRNLADASPNMMWRGTSNAEIDLLNATARQYTGLDTFGPAGHRWTEMIHPDDLDRTSAGWEAAVAGRATFSIEHRIRRADGAFRWHWTVVVPTSSGPDDRTLWIGTATDIHDRKLAEMETTSWRAHFERAQAIGELGSWESEIDSHDGRLVWSSELFRIFGIPPEAFRGRISDFYERVYPDDRERVRQAVERTVKEGLRYTIEHRIVRPDGEIRWVHEVGDVTLSPEGGRRLVGVCRDITERVRAEDERRALEQSLLRAQKLESLGMLAGGIAHDFNNLLVGMLGNASLALLDLPPDAPARQAVRRIETSALRAADLVKQMLAYSGKSALSFERVDASALVGEMGELLATVISKKATLRYELAEALPAIEADPTQLRQIVMNLITNASDALGESGGTITVRTGRVEVRDPANHPLLAGVDAAPGPYVQLEVIDTGIGMDRETQSRIFDPFFTTKFTGRGLGLAAALGIVRSHRGAIGVQSEPGRGTTFTVLLPAAPPLADAVPDVPAQPGTVASARPLVTPAFSGTALVVDDEAQVRQAVGMMLQRFGFTVLTAGSGREGLDVFARHAGALRVVLLDMTMPDLSGAQVFIEMRKIDASVPVVLASGYSEVEATAAFGAETPAAFLQKPFRTGDLAGAVKKALGRS